MSARRIGVIGMTCLVCLLGGSRGAEAQLGALLSPGPLSKVHANLEGISNCLQCHERGRQVSAVKCLTCHAPIADRIARKAGVHRDVKDNCVTCHVEHAGLEGELRPFDQRRFDHAGVAGFALDGKHAPTALLCAACHKTRSFVTLAASCASCHTDVHKGALGKTCTSCHSVKAAFKAIGGEFDHTKAAFQLVGAHKAVACTACHVNKTFKGVKFASCTDCHRDPHRPAGVALATQTRGFGTACTSCHTNDTWRTRKVDHAQTAFPLVGKHTSVDCAACHRQAAMKVAPKSDTCAACHVDIHRGSFRQDCRACHTESGFQKAPFNHTQTAFALTGKHQALTCVQCHTPAGPAAAPRPVPARTASAPRPTAGRGAPPAARPTPAAAAVDFRGLKSACVSCHADVHQTDLGAACESCHSTTTFRLPDYVHPRLAEFFSGQHAPVACEKCHAPEAPTRPIRSGASVLNVKFRNTSSTCVSCHRDVHLGQEGAQCETCHSVRTAAFRIDSFAHAKTGFALTGRHEVVVCALCHKVETGIFPAGAGAATRLKGVSHECRACHADVHIGQLAGACETCHTTSSFHFTNYTHRNRSLSSFFVGRHRTTCAACHKSFTGQFPAGRGTAIRFQTDTRCLSCHEDVHRGSLGPNCGTCHRP